MQNCTRDMAIKHLDDLAEELIHCGIFTNALQEAPDVWSGNVDTLR